MSIDTKRDEITVNEVVYDVERNDHGDHTALTIEEFPGLEGRIGYDNFAEHNNPREWCNAGIMAVSYNRYNLGDHDISEIDFEVECKHCEATGYQDDDAGGEIECPHCERGYVVLHPVDYFKQKEGARVVIPLTVYEHSGITMSAGNVTFPWDTDRWDTSFVGFIYDTPEGVKQCIGENATNEDIEKALRQEVAIYASYLEGDVTEYYVEDDETNYSDGCGGYVGDSDYCEAECFRSMEAAIEKRLEEQQERAEWAARDTVTR